MIRIHFPHGLIKVIDPETAMLQSLLLYQPHNIFRRDHKFYRTLQTIYRFHFSLLTSEAARSSGTDGTLLPSCGIWNSIAAGWETTHFQHHCRLLVVFLGRFTHWELHSLCQASWYFTGSSRRVTGSKSAESMYCKQNKQHRVESKIDQH